MPLPDGNDSHGVEHVSKVLEGLLTSVITVESRLLDLMRGANDRVLPFPKLSQEFASLAQVLQRYYREVVEMKELRELAFQVVTKLNELEEFCMWLFRKIRLEELFYKKFYLEAELRACVSSEAYALYQDIIDAEIEERRLLMQESTALKATLLHADLGAPAVEPAYTVGQRQSTEQTLRDLIDKLADAVWENEKWRDESVETAILAVIRDAIAAELLYRRQQRDIDHRLARLEPEQKSKPTPCERM